MPDQIKAIETKILDRFSAVASSIGYSPLHGKIIAILLVRQKPMSLNEIAKETGYSPGMISLSFDLLEVLGVIRKVKKSGDRKLYVELSGDLLEALKNAILVKLSKSISLSLSEFSEGRQSLEKIHGQESKRVLKTISTLEKEIQRLKTYVDLLSKTRLP